MNWFGWKKDPEKPAAAPEPAVPKVLLAQKSNAIPDETLKRYLDYARSTNEWDKSNSGTRWDGRVIHADRMPPEMEKLAHGVLTIMKETIEKELRPPKRIYPDGYALVRWLPEDAQQAHADAEDPSGIQHPFWWRRYAAIIYINQDFEGGELYFPNQDILIKPAPNLMAAFPSTLEYLHEVKKITQGIRYTLAAFWTDLPEKSNYREIFDESFGKG